MNRPKHRNFERHPSETTYEEHKGNLCPKCTSGSTRNYFEEPCGCGGTRKPHIFEYRIRTPGWVAFNCDCGQRLQGDIGQFTISCSRCSADYNSGGQRLADRSAWGEETGESYADIVRPGDAFEEV
jgi:hypothetical protein